MDKDPNKEKDPNTPSSKLPELEAVAEDSDYSGIEEPAIQDVGVEEENTDLKLIQQVGWMNWINRISNFFLAISMYVLYPAILIVILIDVIGRNFFATPLSWAIEGSGLFLVGAIFLAAPRVELDRNHILLDILYAKYKLKTRLICDILTRSVCCIWMAAATIRSSFEIHTAFVLDETGADFRYPFWPMRAVMTLAFLVLTLALLCNVIISIKRLRSAEGDA